MAKHVVFVCKKVIGGSREDRKGLSVGEDCKSPVNASGKRTKYKTVIVDASPHARN